MKTSDLSSDEYAAYYAKYIKQVGDAHLLVALAESSQALNTLFDTISEDKMDYKYAVGKWTIKELLLHIIDTERVFAYRAMRFAREDKTDLPGFEQDDYVKPSKANNRSKASLLNEYNAQRVATMALFSSFNDPMLKAMGTANSNGMSVRAIGFIIAGHETHHCNIVRERYL
jgi:uncharacterized damage-inducible protein DinB